MKNLSVKNLKKTTRTVCEFTGNNDALSDTTTTTTGTDPTTTTITVTTSTHIF
ncbi:MAG: hypothetical protein ACHQHN_04205 [Sphingobacteriales bacterium]